MKKTVFAILVILVAIQMVTCYLLIVTSRLLINRAPAISNK
jgi:hypothetical protein